MSADLEFLGDPVERAAYLLELAENEPNDRVRRQLIVQAHALLVGFQRSMS